MGLENNNSAVFLSIGDGKITKRVKQPTEKSVQRETKEGKIVNEEKYDKLTGYITDIKTYEHDQWGKFWNIHIHDGDSDYILQMNYSGGYASAFLKTLPNVDLSEKASLVPSMKVEGDKKKTSMFVVQNGTPLKHYWNEENQWRNGELPVLNKVKVKGKLTYDDSDLMEYLERYVTEKILPKLKSAKATAPTAVVAGEEEEADDLPF